MNGKSVPVIGFVGYSDSGKTTAAVQVVQQLKLLGLKVVVVKHNAHGHYIETADKDSSKYVTSGADSVYLVSPDEYMRIERAPLMTLRQLLKSIDDVDLVIAEGFKRESHPKIAVFRDEPQAAILEQIDGLLAVATTMTYDHLTVPVLDLNNSCCITDFITQSLENNLLYWY